MPLLALDDTDTRRGGCTTHTAFRIATALRDAPGPLRDWGLTGPPRLVRLAPVIRERTRGNGAVVLPIGRIDPGAPRQVIGRGEDGRPLEIGLSQGDGFDEDLADALRDIVAAHLPTPGHGSEDPQPGAVLLPEAPPFALYTHAVVRRIDLAEALAVAPPGTQALTPERRGVIGALAASAWAPAPKTMTWEAVAYRTETSTGRSVPPDFAHAVTDIRGGFDNVDAHTGRLRCVPRTPCPVKFGVRGLDPHALLDTFLPLWSDGGGWLMATNHARGDHARHALHTPHPESVVRLDVTVTERPVRARGGHVFVAAKCDAAPLRLAAFEPTRRLAGVVARGLPGDRWEILGRIHDDIGLVALEGLHVLHSVPRVASVRPAPCPACGRAMKSSGRDAPLRCRPCGTRAPVTARPTVYTDDPVLVPGSWHQVADHVRGHLLGPVPPLPPALPLVAATPLLTR